MTIVRDQNSPRQSVTNYRVFLSNEFASRVQRNPAYSLRSFSRSLGISPASLSQILAGKRPLSRKTAIKIADRLLLSPDEKQAFLVNALGLNVKNDSLDLSSSQDLHELQIDTFRLISDWYHYAILGLASLDTNEASPEWVAKKLGISKKEAREGLERLLRLSLIEKTGTGFRQSGPFLKVSTQTHDTAIRKYHSQNLRRALELLEKPDTAVELFSSITMGVNESKLPEARELIKKFRRKLSELVETGKKERVYTLSIQLFPISSREGEENV